MGNCSMRELLPWFGKKKEVPSLEECGITHYEVRKMMAYAYQQNKDGILDKWIMLFEESGLRVPSYEGFRKVERKEIEPIIHKMIEGTEWMDYEDVY